MPFRRTRVAVIGITIILLGLLILSFPQYAYADGSVSVVQGTDSYLIVNNQPARSQLYVSFIKIAEAHVTLSGQTYIFEMTVKSTPIEWLTKAWHPTLTPMPSDSIITFVSYSWTLLDSSGNFLADLSVIWRQTEHGVGVSSLLFVFVCPLGSFPGCEESNIGPTVGSGVYLTPKSMALTVDQSMNSLSVTISQSDLSSVFSSTTFNANGLPVPSRWFAKTIASVTGTSVMDLAPIPTVSTGSVLASQPSLALPT